jgi:hypothetical protein
MGKFSVIIGILLVLIGLMIYISNVRNKYQDIFSMFEEQKVVGCTSPWNLTLSVEHPWVAKLLFSQPLPVTVAQFLVTTINAKQLYFEDVCNGYGVVSQLDHAIDLASAQPDDTSKANAWMNAGGGLAALIPWEAPIVQDYVKSLKTARELQSLWTGGFYQYTIDKYSDAESVDTLWDYLFTTPQPKPNPDDKCNDMASNAVGGAMSGAGLGAMAGGAEAGPIGMLIGGLLGAFSSVAAKGQTSCL